MNGIINHPEGYIASLQKDVDHYVNSGKWVDDMNKLEYEMNEVAKKAAKEAANKAIQKFIKYQKQHDNSMKSTIHDATDMYGDMLNHDEIIKLVHEVYQ